jgi:hypothetical protein
MKRLYFLIFFFFSSFFLFAQKPDDNLIIVTLTDTAKLYERVRQAITFTDLMIREDSKRDTLITYSERVYDKSIFVVAKVVISGNQVRISGAYGLGLEDFWGYPAWPKSYKRAVYFKGSEAWLILRHIAIKLDDKISYTKTD